MVFDSVWGRKGCFPEAISQNHSEEKEKKKKENDRKSWKSQALKLKYVFVYETWSYAAVEWYWSYKLHCKEEMLQCKALGCNVKNCNDR